MSWVLVGSEDKILDEMNNNDDDDDEGVELELLLCPRVSRLKQFQPH